MAQKSKSKSKSKSKKSKKRSTVQWTTAELDVLGSYQERWFLLSSAEEKHALAYGSIAEDLRKLSLDKYDLTIMLQNRELKAEWDKKCSEIKRWYKKKGPAKKERRTFKFERQIALRTVVGHAVAQSLKEAVVNKLPEGKKDDTKEYFKLYQLTLSEFMGKLSKKDRKQYEAIRDEWQADGPPADVQARNAQRYGYRCIEEMHRVANKQFGMLLITFSARPTKNGKWEYFSHDYNQSLNKSEHSVMPMTSWAQAECRTFGKQFAKWVTYTEDAQAGDIDEDNCHSSATPASSIIKLATTETGLPLLPAQASAAEFLKTKREILREFFLQHYCLATGKRKAHPPWLAMHQNVNQFIDSEYIPDGVIVNDPGRMGGDHVTSLLAHLRERQTLAGVPTFLFHQIKRHDNSLAPSVYTPDTLSDNNRAFGTTNSSDFLEIGQSTPPTPSSGNGPQDQSSTEVTNQQQIGNSVPTSSSAGVSNNQVPQDVPEVQMSPIPKQYDSGTVDSWPTSYNTTPPDIAQDELYVAPSDIPPEQEWVFNQDGSGSFETQQYGDTGHLGRYEKDEQGVHGQAIGTYQVQHQNFNLAIQQNHLPVYHRQPDGRKTEPTGQYGCIPSGLHYVGSQQEGQSPPGIFNLYNQPNPLDAMHPVYNNASFAYPQTSSLPSYPLGCDEQNFPVPATTQLNDQPAGHQSHLDPGFGMYSLNTPMPNQSHRSFPSPQHHTSGPTAPDNYPATGDRHGRMHHLTGYAQGNVSSSLAGWAGTAPEYTHRNPTIPPPPISQPQPSAQTHPQFNQHQMYPSSQNTVAGLNQHHVAFRIPSPEAANNVSSLMVSSQSNEPNRGTAVAAINERGDEQGNKTTAKRKRTDSAPKPDPSNAESSSRRTRSKSGALPVQRTKPQSFSSGKCVKVGDRWAYPTADNHTDGPKTDTE